MIGCDKVVEDRSRVERKNENKEIAIIKRSRSDNRTSPIPTFKVHYIICLHSIKLFVWRVGSIALIQNVILLFLLYHKFFFFFVFFYIYIFNGSTDSKREAWQQDHNASTTYFSFWKGEILNLRLYVIYDNILGKKIIGLNIWLWYMN